MDKLDSEEDIVSFIKELNNLYESAKPQAAKPISQNAAPNGPIPTGEFQAPLKGGWNCSGIFDLNMKRPNGRSGHQGVDMRAPGGTPIYPLCPGIVTSVGTDPVGGNVIYIQHTNNIKTYYAHLSVIDVHAGDKVDNDTVIGKVGDNASGTFPHCHFQVWSNGALENPNKYFSVPPYSDLNSEEKKSQWVSEEAKQAAKNFNIQKHISSKKTGILFNNIDNLLKYSTFYYKLVKSAKY